MALGANRQGSGMFVVASDGPPASYPWTGFRESPRLEAESRSLHVRSRNRLDGSAVARRTCGSAQIGAPIR